MAREKIISIRVNETELKRWDIIVRRWRKKGQDVDRPTVARKLLDREYESGKPKKGAT